VSAACRSKLSDYENSGKINEVLEARQQQCRILEQKEEDLLDLVRMLETELDGSQAVRGPQAQASRLARAVQ
jgi:hypothetical protein